jgi:hypothetical protein
MPLFDEALALIRANLEELQKGARPRRVVAIGTLTDTQLEAINNHRHTLGYPPMVAEIVFLGRHIYERRIVDDGYTIDDVIDQIASGMHVESVVFNTRTMTTMQNLTPRADRYGNLVQDQLVFECSGRHPKAELFSVVPKGDGIKPKRPSTE